MTFEAFSPRFEENKNKPQNTNEKLAKALEIDQTKEELSFLKEAKNIREHDKFLTEVNKEIRDLLSNDFFNLNPEKILKLQDRLTQLLGPQYKENNSAQIYAKILEVILDSLNENTSSDEIANKISFILEQNLPFIIDKKFQTFLVNSDFWTYDGVKWTQIANQVVFINSKKWIKLLETYYQPTTDWQFTNIFAA